MENGTKILVDYKVRGQLLPLGTYPTIRKALEGKQDTPQCVKIREKALELGGMEVKPKDNTKNEETNEHRVCDCSLANDKPAE